MRRLRLAGKTFDEIGELYGISGVRVLQVLQQRGSADSARGRRRQDVGDLAGEAGEFLAAHRDAIEVLASSGASRAEVVERFRLFLPETDLAVIGHAITAAGVLFDVDAKAFSFTSAGITAAVWYVLAISLGLPSDPVAAIREADLQEAREAAETLRAAGLDDTAVALVLCRAASARVYARGHPEAGLTRKRYDQLRSQVLQELGLQSRKGAAPWPPTGLTVMKRLGDGYWADALSNIGLTPGGKGRARGLVRFDTQGYESAAADYIRHAAATGLAATKDRYQSWVEAEERAGRHRPSFAALRMRYGTWTAALRVAAARAPLAPQRPKGPRARTLISAKALHDAQAELSRFQARLSDARPAGTSELVEGFTRDFLQEFEYLRRDWLRTMILRDGSVVARFLTGHCTAKIRTALSQTPPDLDGILTDRFLDGLGAGDPRQADGWLRPDAQAQLNTVSDEVIGLYRGLRQARNYLTHSSKESHSGLVAAIQQVSGHDSRLSLNQPLTRRVLIDWLSAKDAQRLHLLSSCIPTLWQAMVTAESILRTPPA
jgi:hypothetical protein